jgi:hypothetical protein
MLFQFGRKARVTRMVHVVQVSPSKAPTSDTLRSQPAASPGRGSPSRLDMRQLAAIFDGHG